MILALLAAWPMSIANGWASEGGCRASKRPGRMVPGTEAVALRDGRAARRGRHGALARKLRRLGGTARPPGRQGYAGKGAEPRLRDGRTETHREEAPDGDPSGAALDGDAAALPVPDRAGGDRPRRGGLRRRRVARPDAASADPGGAGAGARRAANRTPPSSPRRARPRRAGRRPRVSPPRPTGRRRNSPQLVKDGKEAAAGAGAPAAGPAGPRLVEKTGQYGGTWRLGLVGGQDTAWLTRTLSYEHLVRWDVEWTR